MLGSSWNDVLVVQLCLFMNTTLIDAGSGSLCHCLVAAIALYYNCHLWLTVVIKYIIS